ncbi:FAD-binding and (Fe-S)-binding domain-containing protein [Cryobacterium tepidiphilum]|uniref:D-lactate dehydrogenase (cytochrome) n=1 Tax=Cryobacterium tepidiphilum TaxID=2486026 RepID=A0A3M8LF94_9MICO|nr:FAD-binding oxidoreductase [Cryobacterium tepidiphilum]
MAHDASHYLLVPQSVAAPRGVDEIAQLFQASRDGGLPLTFRSGGTSLSGQGVTNGMLVDTRRSFRGIRVLDDGARVQVQPGATVRQVNARLARHARKLGPDPASEIACTIGGVVANNSSGMACGTEQNTYRTIESMVVVLASGTVVDTGSDDADDRLLEREPELYAGLEALRDRVRGNPDSVDVIRRQFSMKNTMGYGVNAFLDFERPVDLLAHLVIGSEGTLGFVADTVFRTVPVLPFAATGLAIFPDLSSAAAALPSLVAAGFATIELMDAASLKVAHAQAGVPPELAALQVSTHAALLVEYQAGSAADLRQKQAEGEAVFGTLNLVAPVVMTTEPVRRADLWRIRKGLYTAVAEARPSGTTALLEDIVVPVPALLGTCETLIELFEKHGYEESVIFGHAKDGNIHFMLNERFEQAGDPTASGEGGLDRYQRFTEDMVALVLSHGGSLKAEHGTGRIMAPFVRRQYGDELYAVMREIKRLFDPAGILNPGTVLSDDPTSYLRDIKAVPTVEAEVDRCVECGYCEPACPSKDVTTTPRQRIVIRREMRTAEAAGDTALLEELREDYDYGGTDTCAVDGMCQVACPVNINTGDLTRRLRTENAGMLAQAGWTLAGRHWDAVTRAGGTALSLADAMPERLVTTATGFARAVIGTDDVPLYDGGLPKGGTKRRAQTTGVENAAPEAVYFPACIGTMFGPAAGGSGVTNAFLELCERAGTTVVVPEGIGSMCCGTPWKSKGYANGYREMTERVLPALWQASNEGALPIVCDAASCTEGLDTMHRLAEAATTGEYSALRFVDAVEFVHERMLADLTVTAPVASIALHHTCSSTQLGTNASMTSIAETIAEEVYVPVDWGCCAFAGDRGLLHPELTASATAREAAEIGEREFTAYASTNRTCELGMTRATGKEYQHILELLACATRPQPAHAAGAI